MQSPSSQPPSPKLQHAQKSAAISALDSIPLKRSIRQLLSQVELRLIARLLREFLASANPKSPPASESLHLAVKALLSPTSKPLARKWKKDQLAQVLLEWITAARNLGAEDQQVTLFVEVHMLKGDKRTLMHNCIFLEEELEDGSIAGFSISSPAASKSSSDSPPAPASASPATPASSASSLARKERLNFEPGSLSMGAREFLRDIDEVTRDEHELANNGEILTPRVPEQLPDRNGEVSSPEGARAELALPGGHAFKATNVVFF